MKEYTSNEQKINEEFRSLTAGIRSVVIITADNSTTSINTFINQRENERNELVEDPNSTDVNKTALHEFVADACFAIKGAYDDALLENDQISFFNSYNLEPAFDLDSAMSSKEQDKIINESFETINSMTAHHKLSEADNVMTPNDLERLYGIYTGKINAIENRLKDMHSKHEIKDYVLISNFNDTLGCLRTNLDTAMDDDDLLFAKYLTSWIDKVSMMYHFDIENVIDKLSSLKRSQITNVADSLNHQLSYEYAPEMLRINRGLLFKVPRVGFKYFSTDLHDVTNDVEFQRIADSIKLLNPRTYFMYIKTSSALYLSLPVDSTNQMMLTALFFAFKHMTKLRDIDWVTAVDELKQDLAYNYKQLDLTALDQTHPLLKRDRPNLLNELGQRTRKFTSAGRNLAEFKLNDIARELDRNSTVSEFLIATSMRNRSENIQFANNLENLEDCEIVAMFNTIAYMIGAVLGNDCDCIWHSFDEMCEIINLNHLDEVRSRLNKVNHS